MHHSKENMHSAHDLVTHQNRTGQIDNYLLIRYTFLLWYSFHPLPVFGPKEENLHESVVFTNFWNIACSTKGLTAFQTLQIYLLFHLTFNDIYKLIAKLEQ